MKRLIYITYLGLLILMLAACQKENVVPVAQAEDSNALDRRKNCQPYEFTNINGYFNLGPAVGNEIVVGFKGHVTLQQQKLIFRNFKEIKGMRGQMRTESGDVTFLALKPGSNCVKTENLIQDLEGIANIRFVSPGLQSGTFWDEFYIFLAPSATEADLIQLTTNTKTKIVADPTVTGFGAYIISADKDSDGNLFEMVTLFSQNPIIEVAEPNGPIVPLANAPIIPF